TNSTYAAASIIEGLNKWEDMAWLNVDNTNIFQKIKYEITTRGAVTTFEWVKGHAGTKGNEEADRLASEGANKEEINEIDLTVPADYKLQGARLQSLTQKLLAPYIMQSAVIMREKKHHLVTKTRRKKLAETRAELQETLGVSPTDRTIWKMLNS
ncbi:hypothetical protein JB92DRAFT_2551909, partial [Gautieria morchelliformis]